MKTLSVLSVVIASALPLQPAFSQEGVPADLAVRQEIHAFPTETLSDEEFLTGTEGLPATIGGILRLPKGEAPFPAMVLVHGSSGMGSNIDVWERQLNGMGIATFAIDSVTGRDLKSLGDKQATLGRLNFALDTYGALEVLASDERIDPDRIGLIGFSRGGQAVLYAAMSRFNELWNTSGATYANFIPFYPNCQSRYLDDEKIEDAPIRIFHGEADDYNPLGVCTDYAERLTAAGADIEITSYPGAHHGYDFPTQFGTVVQSSKSQTARNCNIAESEPGVLMNLDTGEPFSYSDECVELGPHFGGDAEAAADSHARVAAFLTAQFGLE